MLQRHEARENYSYTFKENSLCGVGRRRSFVLVVFTYFEVRYLILSPCVKARDLFICSRPILPPYKCFRDPNEIVRIVAFPFMNLAFSRFCNILSCPGIGSCRSCWPRTPRSAYLPHPRAGVKGMC